MTEFRALPPNREIAHAQIRKAAATYEGHQAELRELNRERYELEQSRGEATRLDVAQAAEAHRAGRKDPGRPNLEKLEERLGEVVRRQAVLAEVVRRDGQDLQQEISKGAGRWQEQIDRRAADARAGLAAALDQVGAAVLELQTSYALRGWLQRAQSYPETAMFTPAAYAGLRPLRTYPTGEQRRPEQLLEDLRELCEAPAEREAVTP